MKNFADYVLAAIDEGYEEGCPHTETRAYELQLEDIRKEGIVACLRHAIDAWFTLESFEEHFGALPPLPGSVEYTRAIASGTAPNNEELRLTREFIDLNGIWKASMHHMGQKKLHDEVEKLVRKYGADFKHHTAYRWLIGRGYGEHLQYNPHFMGSSNFDVDHRNSVDLHNAIVALIK